MIFVSSYHSVKDSEDDNNVAIVAGTTTAFVAILVAIPLCYSVITVWYRSKKKKAE